MADDLDEMTGFFAPSTAYEDDPDVTAASRSNVVPLIRRRDGDDRSLSGLGQAKGRLEYFDDVQPILTCNYLIKGILDVGAMSVVYGPSNSGKTFFAMDLAFHLATGRRWRGRRVKQVAVLYLAAEGGAGAANRVAALRATYGVEGVPFALRRAGLDLLRSEADLQEIFDLVQEMKARWPNLLLVIVVDTLSRVMAGGDENSAPDMTALIRNIDALREATGAHIMLVHHTGKDVSRGARGHSSLRAATDTEIEIQHVDGIRAAHVQKQRDNQGGEIFGFRLHTVTLGQDQDGDEVASCIVAEDDSPPPVKERKLGSQQLLLLETLDQLTAEPSGWQLNPAGVGFPEPGRVRCVRIDVLRAAFAGKSPARNTRDAFKTAFEALRSDRRLICMNGGLVWRVGKPKADNEDQ